MIRSLIIHDTAAAYDWVSAIIGASADFNIVGEASLKLSPVELVIRTQPDLIIFASLKKARDFNSTVKDIMTVRPTPIVLAGTFERGAEIVEALKCGVLDIVEKPAAEDEQWQKRLLETLRIASRIKVIWHVRERSAQPRNQALAETAIEVVGIGASAGGPVTVAQILERLQPIAAPLFVVIHFPDNLATYLREWYSTVTKIPVVEVSDAERLSDLRGKICLAKPGKHLVIERELVRLTDSAPRHYCKPSIDVLFESLAESFGNRAMGVLLTGMGRDGADGLLRLRAAGSRTIAQDEKTSIVFGMPKAAIDLDAAEQVLPPHEIAERISILSRLKEDPS